MTRLGSNEPRLNLLAPLVLACLLAGNPGTAAEPDYDLIIRGGQVVDGTGNPWQHTDIGIRGDRIVDVGGLASARGKREIDARNLVVAPGFIDAHSHSDYTLLEDGRAQSKVRQGVTTEILGEGPSAGPFKGHMAARTMMVGGKPRQWTTLGEYFELLDEVGASVNVASYVGLDNVWQCVLGQSFEPPTAEQLDEMKALVREAMKQGALGLSSQLMMPPGSLATTDQVVALCCVVREYGGIFATHHRDEGLGVFTSVKEDIAIAEKAGIRVDILHLKIADQQYWGRMNEVVALINQARAAGLDVQANVYSYTRGNNNLSSIIPPWAHEGGGDAMLARLRDPGLRERIKKDILEGIPGWYNHYLAVGGDWSRMLVSQQCRFQGLTMDRVMALVAGDTNPPPDPLDTLLDLLLEHEGSISTIYAHHTEEDMNLALAEPWCSIGSDGSALSVEGPLRRGNPHPRNFGTFPRVLGEYVREQGLLSLEDAVRKMTSLNASKFNLRDRGLLREGCFADITLFDPKSVADRATYTEPFEYSAGIEYVIVNGKVVIDRGEHTGALPGRALRNEAKHAHGGD